MPSISLRLSQLPVSDAVRKPQLNHDGQRTRPGRFGPDIRCESIQMRRGAPAEFHQKNQQIFKIQRKNSLSWRSLCPTCHKDFNRRSVMNPQHWVMKCELQLGPKSCMLQSLVRELRIFLLYSRRHDICWRLHAANTSGKVEGEISARSQFYRLDAMRI